MANDELIHKVKAMRPELSIGAITEIVGATFDAVRELVETAPVKVRNFGTFSMKTRTARMCKHPKEGTPIWIPEHKVFHFKASPKKGGTK
jgi:integration host factor subunit beta